MVYLQDFNSASNLSTFYFYKQCTKKYPLKEDFYNAGILYTLMNGFPDNTVKIFQKGDKCGIKSSIQTANIKTIIRFLLDFEYDYTFDEVHNIYGSSKEWGNFFTEALLGVYWESFLAGHEKREQFAFFETSKEV